MKAFKILFTILFCVALLITATAGTCALEEVSEDSLDELVTRYFDNNGLNPDLISIGYFSSGTGETWYWNPDRSYYSASLYKLPLMMMYAEKVSTGELSQDSEFLGLKLSDLEYEILVNSNNDLAYSMLCTLGEPTAVRRSFQLLADQPSEYYDWSFCALSYFNVRFMTDVLVTLLQNQEQFPEIMDMMKKAQPGHYFRLRLGEERFEIAQKYGSYHDEDENDWNHCAGVVFTPEPFALTVMTRYGGISENIIGDLAEIITEYTLRMNQKDTA
ncbi:MAG: class A beta-lactamase-related serine hydrolase [Oscillospiraceae bacterium]|nr:class A beta-lactamase-related serine hydrolase [Oscillospiraceae bacterium]